MDWDRHAMRSESVDRRSLLQELLSCVLRVLVFLFLLPSIFISLARSAPPVARTGVAVHRVSPLVPRFAAKARCVDTGSLQVNFACETCRRIQDKNVRARRGRPPHDARQRAIFERFGRVHFVVARRRSAFVHAVVGLLGNHVPTHVAFTLALSRLPETIVFVPLAARARRPRCSQERPEEHQRQRAAHGILVRKLRVREHLVASATAKLTSRDCTGREETEPDTLGGGGISSGARRGGEVGAGWGRLARGDMCS